MTNSRRLAPLLLLLAGLAVLTLAVALTVHAQSQEVTPTAAATGGTPPAQPTSLQASAEHDSVTLTWTASTDQTVTHYAILRRNRDTDALGVFHVIESNAGPGTSYTDMSVAAASRYGYRAKAVSPTGVSQWSGFVKADTPAAPDPTPTPTPTPEPTPTPGLTPATLENTLLGYSEEEGAGTLEPNEVTFDEGATFRVTSVNTWPGVPGLVLMLTAGSSAQDAALADKDFILEADETVLVVGTAEFSFDDVTLSHSDTTGDNGEYTGVVLATWLEGEPGLAAGETVAFRLERRDRPEEAQFTTHNTIRILVSNVGQGSDDSASLAGNDHAQLFHTAGATNGYTLTSVIVVSEDAQGDDFTVEICLADNTTEFPTSTCTGLREPDSFAAGSLEFTHPGMHLNQNDNYVAVIKQTGTGSVTLDSTTSGGQDSTGLSGWSIKDKFDWKSGGAWQQKGGGDEAIRITVKGYESPANQDATGRPIILTSAEGAPILFADTSDIADGNGLPFTGNSGSNIEFVYSYQWIRVDGGTETDIGADSPSYLLVDADIGNRIKVQVSFTDRALYSETVTSLPFRPVARPAGPSQTPSTLVSNTGQSASATANIAQQYAMEFTLGSYGQGYELSSVSIELAAVPSSLTVSLWIGDHSSQSSSPYTKLFDFENPSSFQVGLNKFTAPAGVLAYPSVHYYIVLSDFGSSLSINETTSDAEDAGGETGATLADNAGGDSNVLRLAVEGSRRARGILASTYAQPFTGDQEIISIGDDCCFRMGVGAADRYLIRGFSWRSDDTTSRGSGILNPWHLREGTSSSGAKQFRLINTRDVAGITEWTAPQGATVVGGSSKTYTFHQNLTTYLDHLGSATRLGGVLTRIFATRSTGYDGPTAPGVTLSPHGDISAAANALLAVLGEPLDAMVQNLGQTDNGYVNLGFSSFQVLSQGFTTGSDAGGYELQGIGINIEGSSSSFPDGPTSVSVAVHADSSGQPGAKLFDLVSPTEYAAGHSFFEAPPGTTLEASTSYVLVWRYNDGTWHRLQRTSSDGEDSGALTGFSIANAFYRGADLSSLSEDSASDALEIAVYGGRATTPTVTAVALTSDPGTDATYAIDDAVNATVTFSEAVDITGAPQLELDFDGAPKTANCAAATNTTTMVCSYTVAENDLAPNGIAIAANKLTRNGGAITLHGAATTAVLTHSAVAIDSGHKVDGVRPTLVTTGNDAPQTSADGTQVIFKVSKDIGSINNGNLDLKKGIVFIGAGSTATFSGRTVTVTLHPIVTIQYDETVTLGIVPGGVRDTAGNSIVRISDQAVTNKVPQPPAVISMVEITSDPGMDSNYATGDDIEVTATFDQAVAVTGKPRIEVRLGTGSPTGRWAEYASGSATTALVFSYTVLATDESDTDGIEVGDTATFSADNVDLNGGTITVAATGEDASLAYTPVVSDSGHRVNWARPTLSSAATFGDGTTVRLTFSENLAPGGRALTLFTVKVDGTTVTLSGTVATVSGRVVTLPLATALTSATQTVTVSYADPTTGDDSAGVEDVAGNDADSFTDQMVTNAFGSAAPLTVTGVEITSGSFNGFNAIDDFIETTVTFSAAVDITGSPQLELDFDGTPKAADCAAATNTTTMVCRYYVAVNDSAPNGIAIAANKLTLNGGTITATGSTTINADLNHAAVAIDAGHKVDGSRPTLVTTGANAPTTSTDGTKVILTFSEDISIVFVDRTKITIMSGTNTLSTSAARLGLIATKVELDLSTVIDATVMLTVALVGDAVGDRAGNGNLAVAATTVINAVGSTTAPTVTAVALVSNIGQAENSTSPIFTYDHAQGFTTGSNSAGYTLTSIEVQISTSGSIASAVVRKTDPNTGDLVAALTGPGTGETVGTGAQTFTAPSGTSLEPSTEYFVVFESGSSANSLRFSVTNANAEDASAAAGWSINNSGHFRNRTQTGNFTAFTGSKRIRVNGTINASPTVTGVEITSLSVDATNGIGTSIEATVTFSAAVDITGTPQLELDFDGTAKPADCVTDTNTTSIGCYYTVAVNDSAPNGIAIAANKLTLNGGTITATGSTTINANLDHAAVAIDAGHKVDGIRPTLVTTGSDAPTTSTDGTQVILTFSEAISSFDVDRTIITVAGVPFYQQGATVSLSGRTVTLTLVSPTFTIVSGQTVTVRLSVVAVRDAAGNGNLALAATAVTNAVGTTPTVTGVRVAPSSMTITEGTSGEYTVVLTGEPSANVTITPSVGGDVTVNPGSLTFTASTWDTAQTVTVSAPQDSDGSQESATIHHAISAGSAPEYVALLASSIGSVQVTVRDDDIPDVVITPAQMTMAEGSTSTYTVALTLRPSSRVTISLKPQRVGTTGRSVHLNTYRLTFTTSNWNTPQTVTVEAQHDDDGNEDVVPIRHKIISPSASEYRNVSIDSVDVTVTDGDPQPVAVLSIFASHTSVNEGGSFVVTVFMSDAHTEAVNVRVGLVYAEGLVTGTGQDNPVRVSPPDGSGGVAWAVASTYVDLDFQPGDTFKTFTVTIGDDSVRSPAESRRIIVGLIGSNSSEVIKGSRTVVYVSVNEDD